MPELCYRGAFRGLTPDYFQEGFSMQIIGIDYSDERNYRCGRIQNTDRPEFVKRKQFALDTRGTKALDAWVEECSAGDHADVAIALCAEASLGLHIAYHFHGLGYAVIPLSIRSVTKSMRASRDRRAPEEYIAQRAVGCRDRWKAMNDVCLEARAAILERGAARLEFLRNQAKSEQFQWDAANDFLAKLTQNAANVHADRMAEAEKRIRSVAKKDDFKKDVARILTIPGMDDITAIELVYFMHAYDVTTSEAFGSLLCLHAKTHIRRENYRWAELKSIRDDVYHMAARLRDSLPEAQKIAERLKAAGKSDAAITLAVAHKIAGIAFAMVQKQQDYRG